MDELSNRIGQIAHSSLSELDSVAMSLATAHEELTALASEALQERVRMQRFLEEFALMGGGGLLNGEPTSPDKRTDSIRAGRKAIEATDLAVQHATALRANIDAALQTVQRCADQLRDESAFQSIFDSEDIRLQLAMNTAREDERRRLAREIHDGPAQVLANAIFGVEIAEQVSRRSPANVPGELKRLRTLLKDGVAEIRRFMFDLRPTMLEDQGLVPTLRRYVDDFNRFFGKQVDSDMDAAGARLSADQELAVFRTVQEALQNFQKYAGVDEASVCLSITHEWCDLVVNDDGRGFEPDAVQSRMSGGSGLKGMRDRATLIGADLEIASAPGEGTAIRLRFARRPRAGERERE